MSTHNASIEVTCLHCGSKAVRMIVAKTRGVEIRMSASTQCMQCGWSEEYDGDELTEEARAAFYAIEGRWTLVVDDLGPRRAEAVRVLKTFDSRPLPELLSLVREKKPIATGTLVELERITESLAPIAARFEICRVAAATK